MKEKDRTILEVRRPRGLTPDALYVDTETPFFIRAIEVWDGGQGIAESPLGLSTILRIKSIQTIEELEVELREARGDLLKIVIIDQDSPALEDISVSVIVRKPSLIFHAGGKGSQVPCAKILFSGGRAYRPKYDLSALVPSLAVGRPLGDKLGIYEQSSIGRAWVGEIERNTFFDDSPALAFAMRPGATIDARRFSHRRPVRVPLSREGLVKFRLSLEDLAVSRPDFGDIRIVDSDSRQWPYLIEPGRSEEWIDIHPPAPPQNFGNSVYELSLPVTPVNIDELVLSSGAAYFDREFLLEGTFAKNELIIAQGRLARRIGDLQPVSVEFPAQRIDSLSLTIHDGDEAPLIFNSIKVRAPVPEIFLTAPPGEYSLLVGNPEELKPDYELAHVRDIILAVGSDEAASGGIQANPKFSVRARLATGGGPQRVVFWVGLGIAVAVLILITLKLARSESPSSQGKD